jgi:NarL family two-component system response regulator LiaR
LIRELSRPTDRPVAGVPLTDRERHVVRLVAQGLSNDEVAAKMHLGERTVRTHISHILRKLHLANRTQLALYALRTGLARPDAG